MKVCHIDHWRVEAYPILDVDSDGQHAKKVAFQRARQRLHEAGYVETMGGFWWAIFDDAEPAQTGTLCRLVPTISGTARHTPLLKGVPIVPVESGEPGIVTEDF